jgi:guanosine-diphosphatase
MDSESPNPSFRYQALGENLVQPNNSERNEEIIFYGDNPFESPMKKTYSGSNRILSLFRQGIIMALLFAIFAGYLFSTTVNYDRKSAHLFRSGLCSRSPATKFSSKYAVVFDAGSTGSRVHVYEFQFCGQTLLNLVDEVFEHVRPGLSSYSEKPQSAVESIAPLMREAWRRVPRDMRRCTPIVLKATAGLRLLPAERVGSILGKVKHFLKKQNFHLGRSQTETDPVSVIDGSEEAISAWISVNFLQKRIGPQQQGLPSQQTSLEGTSVVLEMGGGSSQLVFDQSEKTAQEVPTFINDLRFFGRKFNLYQHSYLGYGLMEARKRVKFAFEIKNKNNDETFPCFPSGYTEKLPDTGFKLVGSSKGWESCAELIREVLFEKNAECVTKPCAFNGVFQPKIPENAPIYALSYVYDRARELGLDSNSYTLGELRTRGQKVCSDGFEGNALYKKYPDFCFDLAFIHSLLNHGFGISEDRKIQSGFQIGNYETGWTLGSALSVVETSPTFCNK